MAANQLDRRSMLHTAGVVATALLAGCSSGASPNDTDDGGDDVAATVSAGPGGALAFEPKTVTIERGETVTWTFDSPNHNVSCWPAHGDEIAVPEGADGFGTMDADGDEFSIVEKGETFSHTFETAGTYEYVCVPHVSAEMVGTVEVE